MPWSYANRVASFRRFKIVYYNLTHPFQTYCVNVQASTHKTKLRPIIRNQKRDFNDNFTLPADVITLPILFMEDSPIRILSFQHLLFIRVVFRLFIVIFFCSYTHVSWSLISAIFMAHRNVFSSVNATCHVKHEISFRICGRFLRLTSLLKVSVCSTLSWFSLCLYYRYQLFTVFFFWHID